MNHESNMTDPLTGKCSCLKVAKASRQHCGSMQQDKSKRARNSKLVPVPDETAKYLSREADSGDMAS